MSDFIGIDVSGLTELTTVMQRIPDAAADDGVEAANSLIIDIMRLYGQYQYINRQQVPWVSERQRRYVMMMINKGFIKIPYPRTQELSQGWHTIGSGQYQLVVNEVPYAMYPMGDDNGSNQAMRFKYMGWDTAKERILDRIDNILMRFAEGVNKALRRLNLN